MVIDNIFYALASHQESRYLMMMGGLIHLILLVGAVTFVKIKEKKEVKLSS